jgi:hypothetical protein
MGGATIAVVEDENGLELDMAEEFNPALFPIARPASGAALSDDGRYLSWDLAADPSSGTPGRLVTLTLVSGLRDPILTRTSWSSPTPTPLRPAVSTGSAGPIVAWYATIAGGIVYPAFRDYAHTDGAVISNVAAPVWIALHGSTLILISIDPHGGGNVASAFDLSKSGFTGS